MAQFYWTRAHDFGPIARFAHALAYDAARKQTVLFGGNYSVGGPDPGTWVWDGSNWTQVSNSGPPVRWGMAMAYDSKRQNVVLFGGDQIEAGGLAADTWTWDGAQWTQVAKDGPPARRYHAMAFDSHSGRTLMTGGIAAAGALSDTWVWDGNAWTKVDDGLTGGLSGHCMAYDSARDRVVLFGGVNPKVQPAAAVATTLEWTGATWQEVSNFGPQARYFSTIAFDAANKRCVMFGGQAFTPAGLLLNDTWEWDGQFWTERQNFGPPTLEQSAMVSDDARGHLVLFGGISNINPLSSSGDVWEGYEHP